MTTLILWPSFSIFIENETEVLLKIEWGDCKVFISQKDAVSSESIPIVVSLVVGTSEVYRTYSRWPRYCLEVLLVVCSND